MAFIYKITNDINEKVYIGKTNSSIEKRFAEHCRDSKRKGYAKRPLYSAMNKYGCEHFKTELIEEIQPEKSCEREIYWIEQYRSFHNGYNATIGGDGKNYVDYGELIDLYNHGNGINEIKNITGHDESTIRNAIHSSGITKEQIQERKLKKRYYRPVAQIDPKTNKIVAIYDSIAQAEESTGNTRHIIQVCTGRRKTCKGYK